MSAAASISQSQRTKFVDDTDINSGPKVEYKEYSFQTNPNKEVENKISEFWKALGTRKPPNSKYFKQPDLSECFKSSISGEEESIEDTERKIIDKTQKYQWTNTFCMFKKKGLYDAAAAAVPKQCKLCDNDKYAPKYADEDCEELLKVELEDTKLESPKMQFIRNK